MQMKKTFKTYWKSLSIGYYGFADPVNQQVGKPRVCKLSKASTLAALRNLLSERKAKPHM